MYSFPKSSRLLLRKEYVRVASSNHKYTGKLIYIDILPNGTQSNRLGITVTKKYGNSCKRNRFKRISREAFRLCSFCLPKGVDVIIRPRKFALEATSGDIQAEMMHLLKKEEDN